MTEALIKNHRFQLAGATTPASSLKELENAVGDTPAVDPARVATVRDALARGAYQINRERIADKLLQLDAAAKNRGR